jgi:hypothetical protein
MPAALELRQSNSALGQTFKHQVIKLPLLRQLAGRGDAIARKTSACAYAQHSFFGRHGGLLLFITATDDVAV